MTKVTIDLDLWRAGTDESALRRALEHATRDSRDNEFYSERGHTELKALKAVLAALPKPKPEEPTGLGAVVEDREGALWVRLERPGQWLSGYGNTSRWYSYADIDAVKVLSPGV